MGNGLSHKSLTSRHRFEQMIASEQKKHGRALLSIEILALLLREHRRTVRMVRQKNNEIRKIYAYHNLAFEKGYKMACYDILKALTGRQP